jgi:hypothetical protein
MTVSKCPLGILTVPLSLTTCSVIVPAPRVRRYDDEREA